jgi:acylphosphatase
MPEIRLKVVGRVQGVGFRWFVRERAVELGLSGWVRNTNAGDVELVASGEQAKLSLLEVAVTKGPRGALVAAVSRESPAGNTAYPTPFRIEP